jgi:S-adenosylmethionine synthetase
MYAATTAQTSVADRQSSHARLMTAESVTEGHPDKVCDQISDAILDACLAQDPQARVAVETLVSGNTVMLAGELSSTARIDPVATARQVIREIGYVDPRLGFDCAGCFILTSLRGQSADIDRGVSGSQAWGADIDRRVSGSQAWGADIDRVASRGQELGAGDQGVFYGFACDETASRMPAPIHLAHALARRLAAARWDGSLPWLRPDGKTQVTLRYDGAGRPVDLASVVLSAQHDEGVDRETLVRGLVEAVLHPEVGAWLRPDTRVLINPTGRFVTGGPAADTGLTGRKLMVDTYGGCARHGGGAFSGKDATKVDRTAAYMARHVAKTLVAAGLASRCEVALAFAIGQCEPEMVAVDTFGTGTTDPERLAAAVREVFPLSVSGMIAALQLRRPRFRETASYGHFGRDGAAFSWERTDRAEDLRTACGG